MTLSNALASFAISAFNSSAIARLAMSCKVISTRAFARLRAKPKNGGIVGTCLAHDTSKDAVKHTFAVRPRHNQVADTKGQLVAESNPSGTFSVSPCGDLDFLICCSSKTPRVISTTVIAG